MGINKEEKETTPPPWGWSPAQKKNAHGVKEEGPVRKAADKVIAPVLLDNPVLSHTDIIPKTRLLYQFHCINKLTLFLAQLSCPSLSYRYPLSVGILRIIP